MTEKAKTETELQAWDIYFAAALPLAKEKADASGLSENKSWDKLLKVASEVADDMLKARRLRG
ncbi:hypothetical protein [Pseudomonas sp. GM30]|uniref:hypothetical protein n=1 Tax=Pseudomonas sp. GM30 TaxID=1144328 RepID=UPI00026FD96E|nr:hypothetical protein [Pseudomonas sp. GM30]EUB84892.1 hypothetical protein PMI25_001269 [Pseudomonas sp. GM30]